jgi:phosphomannomutase/phosphoglucomutase
MITASHNPPQYNGFKVMVDRSSLYGEGLKALYRYIEERRLKRGKGKLSKVQPIPHYIEWLTNHLPIRSGLRVAFDPGNGTVGVMLESLFSKVLVEPFYINLEPDPKFPAHLPDPTVPEYLKDLISIVHELDCDLGIGYDGDGDRIGVVDERGQIIFGDQLLGIFAREVLKDHPGAKVIFDVKCSQGLIEYLESLGGVPVMYRTGHSLIKAKLKEEGAPLAGEMSGHIFFADEYFGYDDAIYASLRLLRILADSGQPLSNLVAEIPSYPSTPELRVECPDERKFEVVKTLAEEFSSQYEVVDLDGARVVFPDGWGLIRASNTQPALVLRFEAKSEAQLEEIRSLFFKKLKALGLRDEASSP